MREIFVSYRRDDVPHLVGRVVADLRRCFGKDAVFQDVGDIHPGEPWPERIREELAQCNTMLAFIGEKWHRSWDDNVGPRLWDANDWVRNEICTGLEEPEKSVIPILVDGAEMPRSGALPTGCSLTQLPDRQPARIRILDYDTDMAKIISRLGGSAIMLRELADLFSRQAYAQVHIEQRSTETLIRIQRRNDGDAPS